MTKKKKSDCLKCDGTGYVCANCDEADGQCTCDDGPEEVRCDECGGSGENDD